MKSGSINNVQLDFISESLMPCAFETKHTQQNFKTAKIEYNTQS